MPPGSPPRKRGSVLKGHSGGEVTYAALDLTQKGGVMTDAHAFVKEEGNYAELSGVFDAPQCSSCDALINPLSKKSMGKPSLGAVLGIVSYKHMRKDGGMVRQAPLLTQADFEILLVRRDGGKFSLPEEVARPGEAMIHAALRATKLFVDVLEPRCIDLLSNPQRTTQPHYTISNVYFVPVDPNDTFIETGRNCFFSPVNVAIDLAASNMMTSDHCEAVNAIAGYLAEHCKRDDEAMAVFSKRRQYILQTLSNPVFGKPNLDLLDTCARSWTNPYFSSGALKPKQKKDNFNQPRRSNFKLEESLDHEVWLDPERSRASTPSSRSVSHTEDDSSSGEEGVDNFFSKVKPVMLKQSDTDFLDEVKINSKQLSRQDSESSVSSALVFHRRGTAAATQVPESDDDDDDGDDDDGEGRSGARDSGSTTGYSAEPVMRRKKREKRRSRAGRNSDPNSSFAQFNNRMSMEAALGSEFNPLAADLDNSFKNPLFEDDDED